MNQEVETAQNILLEVAGIKMSVQSEVDFLVEPGFKHFLIQDGRADVQISYTPGLLSRDVYAYQKPLFEAFTGEEVFYRIFKYQDALLFEIFDQNNQGALQHQLIPDESFTHWKVLGETAEVLDTNPLKYPTLPIMLHYICLSFDAVMIHASCVDDAGQGRVFSGFSGAGKSTMSGIWSGAGRRIVNDDRLIIRKSGDAFKVYNTPMYYVDFSKSVPLKSVYLIRHSLENQIRKLNGALAATRMLAFIIQHNFDEKVIAHHLKMVQEISERVNIYDLGVVPDHNIIDFVLKAEE